jgi:16S rRNA processing protein RimM
VFNSEKYYQFGKILRSHGVKGGIVLEVDLDVSDEDIKKLELVFVLIDNLPVPFFIEEIKTYTKNRFIVKFQDIDDIDLAEELCVSNIVIEKSQIPEYEHELSFEDLIGYSAFDEKNNLGIIDEYFDINMNPTFKIVNEEQQEIIIPANLDFIIEVDEEKKIVLFNIPDGLLDLY